MQLPTRIRDKVTLAADGQTSADILLLLATDESRTVRIAVCDNKSATAEVISAALQCELANFHPSHSHTLVFRVVRHRAFNESVMLRFVDTKVCMLQYAIASSPRATPTVLSTLACHALEGITEEILSNPSAPEELLIAHASAEDAKIVHAVTKNPNAPAAALSIVANNPKWRDDPSIGYSLLSQRNCPKDVILTLVNEDRPGVLLLGQFLYLPPAVLDAFSASSHYHVRRVVAAHPNTALETLQRMRNDKTPSVRTIARRRLGETDPA